MPVVLMLWLVDVSSKALLLATWLDFSVNSSTADTLSCPLCPSKHTDTHTHITDEMGVLSIVMWEKEGL